MLNLSNRSPHFIDSSHSITGPLLRSPVQPFRHRKSHENSAFSRLKPHVPNTHLFEEENMPVRSKSRRELYLEDKGLDIRWSELIIKKKIGEGLCCQNFHRARIPCRSLRGVFKVVSPLDEDEDENKVRLRETNVVVESGPSVSDHHHDDDCKDRAIGVIMEPIFNVYANGRFRRRITSWQKGEPLGSGSFGIVYEGFTDDGFFFAVKEVSLQDQGNQGKQSILQLE